MSVKWKLYVFLMLNKHNMHRTFAFWSMRLSREYTSILHNRRACSALQGLGGWATNKQRAKSPTIALLASIDCSYCFAGMRIFSTDSSFPLIVRMARVIS